MKTGSETHKRMTQRHKEGFEKKKAAAQKVKSLLIVYTLVPARANPLPPSAWQKGPGRSRSSVWVMMWAAFIRTDAGIRKFGYAQCFKICFLGINWSSKGEYYAY